MVVGRSALVVHLCHHLLQKSRASLLAQLVSSLTDSELKSYESDLNHWANFIKDKADLLRSETVEEQSSRVKSLLKFSDSENHRILSGEICTNAYLPDLGECVSG
jgi:ankyrin repeat domain-containing protein 50